MSKQLSPEEITATAIGIVEDLDHLQPLDVATILTLASAVVLMAAATSSREQTADIFRDALLDQMTRLDGRATTRGNPTQ